MKFSVKADKKSVQTSEYINKSGLYDLTVNFIQLKKSERSDAMQLVFHVTYQGTKQHLYGPYITNKAGELNEVSQKFLNRFFIVCGFSDNTEFETVEKTIFVGKNRKKEETEIIDGIVDQNVIMQIKFGYSRYNGNIQERTDIPEVFRAEDCASAKEIIYKENLGEYYGVVKEKYADAVSYDDVTPQQVAEWKANRGNSKTVENTPAQSTKSSSSNDQPLFT